MRYCDHCGETECRTTQGLCDKCWERERADQRARGVLVEAVAARVEARLAQLAASKPAREAFLAKACVGCGRDDDRLRSGLCRDCEIEMDDMDDYRRTTEWKGTING